MSSVIQTRRELLLAVLSAAFVLFNLWILHVHYTINDDTAILANAMGGYPVRYMGILLTSLLHTAYNAFPGVAWLGVALYALLTLSLYLWLSLVWRVFKSRLPAAMGTLLVLGYYLLFLASLDYTSVSVMLCMASITWACMEMLEARRGYGRLIWSGIVFMLGMLVRPQGAPGALAYALPLLFITALAVMQQQPSWNGGGRRLALAALVFLVPALGNYVVDGVWRQATLTPQQEQYDAFNSVRGRLHRISRERKQRIIGNPVLLASVHWTRHDADYFFNWKFLDERTYTPEVLQTLFDNAPPPKLSLDTLGDVFIQRLPPYSLIFPVVLASLAFFLPLLAKRRWMGLVGSLIPVYCVCLTVFMYVFFAFTYRVELPFVLGLGFGSLLIGGFLAFSSAASGDARRTFLAGLGFAVAITAMGFSVYGVLRGQEAVSNHAQTIEHRLQLLNANYAGDVLLVEPNSMRLEALSPLKPLELQFQTIDLGWNTFSPRFYHAIGMLGAEHGYQVMDALIDNPHGYLLATRDWCEAMLVYVKSRPTEAVEIQKVMPVTGSLGLYRLVGRVKPAVEKIPH